MNWRFFVKHRLFATLREPGGPEDVFHAYEAVRAEFGDLPPVR